MNVIKPNILDFEDNFALNKDVRTELISGPDHEQIAPEISIIIPTYKRPALLREAILSALNQKDAGCSYEVIVIDNECEPVHADTEHVIRSMPKQNLSYYRNTANLGMYGNINRGIELARGRWVACLHDDDLLLPDYLQKMSRLIARKNNIGVVIPNIEVLNQAVVATDVPEDNSSKSRCPIKQRIRHAVEGHLIRIRPMDCILSNNNIYGPPSCGMIFRKEYIVREGGFSAGYYPAADWFMLFKYNHHYRIFKSFAVLGQYRILENESMNDRTITGFVKNYTQFKDYSVTTRMGSLVNTFFGNELYADFIENILRSNKASHLQPSQFNGLIEYKPNKIRLQMLRRMIGLHWKLKTVAAVLWG
jgi:glycosyltransferase involved in cell wall biosynthesis